MKNILRSNKLLFNQFSKYSIRLFSDNNKKTVDNTKYLHKVDNEGYFHMNSELIFPIKNRSVVSVRGKDSKQLIQSLTTNDINELNCDNSKKNIVKLDNKITFKNNQISQSSLFLNHKGKILFDTFITRSHL